MRRLRSLAVGLLVMLCAGTPYMFGVFDTRLKRDFGLSQTSAVLVETSVQVGMYCGLTQGGFYDRYGVRAGALLATALLFAGYTGAYLSSLLHPPAALLAVCFFCIGQGSHGFYTSATMTNVLNFAPQHQGSVMGALAAAFGLSGAVFALLENRLDPPLAPSTGHSGQCGGDEATAAPNATAALHAVGRNSSIYANTSSSDFLTNATNSSSALLGTNSSSDSSVGGSSSSDGGGAPMPFFLVTALILCAVGVLAAVFLRKAAWQAQWQPLPTSDGDGAKDESESMAMDSLGAADAGGDASSSANKCAERCKAAEEADGDRAALLAHDSLQETSFSEVQLQEAECEKGPHSHLSERADKGAAQSSGVLDITGLALARNLNFWLLFLGMAVDDGSAVMFLNSLVSMRNALGEETVALSGAELVGIFSACSTAGRLVWGILSDRCRVSRPAVLLISMAGMLLGHLQLAMLPTQLVSATVIIGLCFGGLFALAPVIVSDLFGAPHFGTNWGIVVLAPAIGSLSFGSVYGRVYDSHATRDATNCHACFGADCFRAVFIVTSSCLVVACALTLLLARRTRAIPRSRGAVTH